MNKADWIVITLAYIVGLLATGLFYFDTLEPSWLDLVIVAISLGVLSLFSSFTLPKYLKVKLKIWLIAYAIALIAVIYFQLRIPSPQVDDISYQITSEQSQVVLVTGQVIKEPRLSGNQKLKFWLQAETVSLLEKEELNIEDTVSGKLYVTVPLLPENQIYPGAIVKIKGVLYQPRSPKNPGTFDFKTYLHHQGIFAGLKGLSIDFNTSNSQPNFGWWQLRRRIIRAQVKALGSPLGQLLGSIVLGRRAVDLPEDIRNLFITAGLAHILAASGFHVSLLLGVILKLTNSLSAKLKLILGTMILLIYLSLTGFSPSIIRAGLMGLAVLIATAMGGKVKPQGALLVSAVIILLVNPLWIWSLSFQLSFLATLGLLVTAPVIEKRLDWMPPTFAIVIAFPLAAIIWTLPLVTYYFNSIATYSILVNIITTPLVTVISLGGMISGFAALIFPLLGSIVSWILYYPILTLVAILRFFTSLPGSVFAIGKISLGLLILIYGVICLVWINKRLQKYWHYILLSVMTLIILPIIYSHFNLVQVTILATKPNPIIVIQDCGEIIVINDSQIPDTTIKYNLLPFLSHQGINNIGYNVTFDTKLFTSEFTRSIKPSSLIDTEPNWQQLETNNSITANSTKLFLVSQNIFALEINNQDWLLVINSTAETLSFIQEYIQQHDISTLLWWGNNLESSWLNSLGVQTAIVSDGEFNSTNSLVTIYRIDRDGAIIWQPDSGFDTQLFRNLEDIRFAG
ncbi:ComEC/Rec2-related protein [Xenococcus sp. PCC 7305]|uniref:ComEC/Rec2 family competence protein n=1 Tax=Xenococcus sp. PCC 7305 TaxID=102125 RepID=UPI0002AC5C28|nr:ComEC/Rec2 family competence protein [Xenococcus sp. PCC 7305]ELS00522.1 ComEC/Rec2-related protein [Xenococcus sp. PCC 7305]